MSSRPMRDPGPAAPARLLFPWASLACLGILTAAGAWAGDSATCRPAADPSESLVRFSKTCLEIGKKQSADERALAPFSVSPADVKKAPCMRKKPFGLEEMQKAIDQYAARSSDRVTRTIHGIAFTDENPKLLDLFEKLTTYDGWSDGKSPERQATFQSSCAKVRCAIQELFGEKVGLQSLFALSRYGYNTSHLTKANAAPWRPEELDTVLLGLSAYPPASLPIEENHPLIHASRGGAAIANAGIILFDLWNKDSDEEKLSTIVHEVGHNFSTHFSNIDASKTWLDMSGWTTKTLVAADGKEMTEATATNRKAIVSLYGNTKPSEDFAESVAAYRFNPALLKARSPKKYLFLRDTVFDGLEYLSQKTCSRPSESDKLSPELRAAAAQGTLSLPPKDRERIGPRCGVRIFDLIEASMSATSGGPDPLSSSHALDECIAQALAQAAALRIAQAKAWAYPEFTLPILSEAMARLSPSTPDLAATRAAVIDAARARFVDLASSIDQEQSKRLGTGEGAPPLEPWCDTWSLGRASPEARAAFEAAFNGQYEYAAFERRELISRALKRICVAAHQGEWPLKPPSREALADLLAGLPQELPAPVTDDRIYGNKHTPRLEGLVARARLNCDLLYLTKKSGEYDACVREAGKKTYLAEPPEWAAAFVKNHARAELELIFGKAMLAIDGSKKYLYEQDSTRQESPEKFCSDWGWAGRLPDAGMNGKAGFNGPFVYSHLTELTHLLTELCTAAQKKMGKDRKPLNDAVIRKTVSSYFDSL